MKKGLSLPENNSFLFEKDPSGLLLVLPSIVTGFFADDFGHYVLMNEPGLIPQSYSGSLFHLFSFIDNDASRRELQVSQSLIPWWTSETLSINFWRPVSELTHYIDFQLLKGLPWLMHLHSLIWYGLLVFLLWEFYQKIFANRQLAVFALLFFVVDASHGLTVAWIANRNALIAALFVVMAIVAHHQARAEKSSEKLKSVMLNSTMLVVSCFFLALAFLSAEIAISAGAFLLAYALFLDKSGAIKGLLYLLPALLVFIIWQFVYHQGFHKNQGMT